VEFFVNGSHLIGVGQRLFGMICRKGLVYVSLYRFETLPEVDYLAFEARTVPLDYVSFYAMIDFDVFEPGEVFAEIYILIADILVRGPGSGGECTGVLESQLGPARCRW